MTVSSTTHEVVHLVATCDRCGRQEEFPSADPAKWWDRTEWRSMQHPEEDEAIAFCRQSCAAAWFDGWASGPWMTDEP